MYFSSQNTGCLVDDTMAANLQDKSVLLSKLLADSPEITPAVAAKLSSEVCYGCRDNDNSINM